MTEADLMDVAREGIWVMIKISAPVLIVALVVGVAIAILQSVTQLQEQTLSFVPKVLLMFGSLILFLPFMIGTLNDFWKSVLDKMIAGGGG